MKRSIRRYAILTEVVLSFAFPVFALANGVLTLPIWVAGATRGAGFATINVLCVIGGCLGVWAVQEATKYYVAEWPVRKPRWLWPIICADSGVVALWTVATGQFTGVELNWFAVLFAVVPTLCTVHIFVLAIQKSKMAQQCAAGDVRNARA